MGEYSAVNGIRRLGVTFLTYRCSCATRSLLRLSVTPTLPHAPASPYITSQPRELVMNTPAQIRASRVLLGWDQHDLASAAGVDRSTIQRMEHLGPEHCERINVSKVREALEAAG